MVNLYSFKGTSSVAGLAAVQSLQRIASSVVEKVPTISRCAESADQCR